MQTRFKFPIIKQKGILILLIALLCATFSGTVYLFQLPIASSSLEVLSNYTHRGIYTYDLYLHPNLLFTDPVIHGTQGGHYFKNITDHIDIMFTYQFLCEPPANVTGTLETNATLFSVTSRDGTVLWQKDLATLTPSLRPYQGSETTVQIPFDLDGLYSLITQIEQEIKVYSTKYQVTMSAKVQTLAETRVGTIDETFHAMMVIYFEDNLITIASELTHEQPGTIEHLNTLSFPWVNNWRVGAIIILAMLTVVTGYYVPIYRRTVIHRSTENVVQKILEKYDDLIISTTQNITMPDASKKNLISVETIEDLSKIAEQTSKPILYIQNSSQPLTSPPAHIFFIHDTDMIYTLRIDEKIPDPPLSNEEITSSSTSVISESPLFKLQILLLKLQPLFLIAGILVVGAVFWLTVYEGISLGRGLTSIFLGPRSLFFDLGIGLRIIHYLGLGIGCCVVGSWTVIKRLRIMRWFVSMRSN